MPSRAMLCNRLVGISMVTMAMSLYACFLCLTFSVLNYLIEYDRCLLNITCFSFPSYAMYVHC